jgi:hypothetical protein
VKEATYGNWKSLNVFAVFFSERVLAAILLFIVRTIMFCIGKIHEIIILVVHKPDKGHGIYFK